MAQIVSGVKVTWVSPRGSSTEAAYVAATMAALNSSRSTLILQGKSNHIFNQVLGRWKVRA
jgi:ribosomal protein S5